MFGAIHSLPGPQGERHVHQCRRRRHPWAVELIALATASMMRESGAAGCATFSQPTIAESYRCSIPPCSESGALCSSSMSASNRGVRIIRYRVTPVASK